MFEPTTFNNFRTLAFLANAEPPPPVTIYASRFCRRFNSVSKDDLSVLVGQPKLLRVLNAWAMNRRHQ